jgi:uncharacterized protein YicC (UPF0701 family)
MQKRKSIRDMAAEKYDDPAIIDAVIDHATKSETVARIEAGELVLPSEQDAVHWHARITGKVQAESQAARDRERIAALEEAYAKLNAERSRPDERYVRDLEARLKEIESTRK